MRKIVVAALTALLVATPAWADWAPTKWGADRDATIAVLGSTAKPIEGTSGQRVADQDWRARRPGTFEGIVVAEDFFFDPKAGGLSLVRLTPADTDCPAFIAAVRKRYGKPANDSTDTIKSPKARTIYLSKATWTDSGTDLAIMLSTVVIGEGNPPFLCQVTYEPYAKR